MSIQFPNNPTNGQTYTSGGRTWTYNGKIWYPGVAVGSTGATGATGITGATGPAGSGGGGGGATVTVSSSAPVSPSVGAIWLNDQLGDLFVYSGSGWTLVGGWTLVNTTGSGSNEYPQLITSNVTITTGSNRLDVGPVTLQNNASITVNDTQAWQILG